MTRRKRVKRLIYIGLPALVVLLVGAALTTYFWQMRLQKPEEMNMAQHQMTAGMHDMAGMAHMAGMESSSSAEGGVSCAALTAPESSAPVRKFDLTAARTTLRLDNGKKVEA